MATSEKLTDAEAVAILLDALIRDAERVGVAPGVLRELHTYLDHACDRAEHARRGWR
jgi:DNA repair protein RadC